MSETIDVGPPWATDVIRLRTTDVLSAIASRAEMSTADISRVLGVHRARLSGHLSHLVLSGRVVRVRAGVYALASRAQVRMPFSDHAILAPYMRDGVLDINALAGAVVRLTLALGRIRVATIGTGPSAPKCSDTEVVDYAVQLINAGHVAHD